MRKTLIYSLLSLIIISCATTQTKSIVRVEVPAFEILIIPEMRGRGYWIESMRLLIIEGRLDSEVLGHEMKEMLRHLDPKLFPDPHDQFREEE